MFDDDIREIPSELKTMIKTRLSSVYGKTVNDLSYESTNKVIKSYALDRETIEAIDNISSVLGIKSRSETLREIVKRYDECRNQKSILEN